MPDRYDTDYEIGQDNLQKYGMDVHHPVFWIASVLILLFVVGTLLVPESAKEAFDGAKGWSINLAHKPSPRKDVLGDVVAILF